MIDLSTTHLSDHLKLPKFGPINGEKLRSVLTHIVIWTNQKLLCIYGYVLMQCIWRNVLTHICRSIGRHFKRSVDVFINMIRHTCFKSCTIFFSTYFTLLPMGIKHQIQTTYSAWQRITQTKLRIPLLFISM